MRAIISPQTEATTPDQACLLVAGWLRGCLGWYHTIDPNGALDMANMAALLEGNLPMGCGMGSVSIPAPGLGHINLSISGGEARVSVLHGALADDWGPESEDVLWVKGGSIMLHRSEWVARVGQAIQVRNVWATIFKMTRKFSVHWQRADECLEMDEL